jgi:pimeloyl-ACP methyl ester carboxylesterase
MKLVDLGDAKLAVHEWGERDGVPLVFWHALGPLASGAELGEIAPVLADAGFRPIAIDGPGFGRSPLLPPDRYETASLVALVHRFVDEFELDRPVLMGHSWGGVVALSYAASHPDDVRALVLLDSGHIDYGDLPDVELGRSALDWIETAREREWRWESKAELKEWLREHLTRTSPAVLAAYGFGARADGGALVGSSPEARGAAMYGLTAPVSAAWPSVAEHEIPTLVLLATEPPHGDQNRQHIARFQAALPQATVRFIDGAGHGILADIGPPLGDEIADWLVEQGL